MFSEKEFPFSTKQLLRELPAPRSAAEIGDKYRALFSECINAYANSRTGSFSHLNKIPELTISLAKDISTQFGRLLKWTDELIPEFDIHSAEPIPVYATRSMTSPRPAEKRVVESYSFEKFGNDCSAKIVLEVTESNLNMTISLHDDSEAILLPFNLTITDQESAQTLLDRKEFATGAARIRGLERGEYAIRCEQGGRVCGFAIRVK